jgi:hypothetical protein
MVITAVARSVARRCGSANVPASAKTSIIGMAGPLSKYYMTVIIVARLC